MAVNVLFSDRPERWAEYEEPLKSEIAALGIAANLGCDIAPDQVDYIVYSPSSPLKDFGPYTRAKAVLNLWAGVEAVVGNPTLKIPLTRMVDPGLTQGMVEWVTGHVLRHHLGMDRHITDQSGRWEPEAPPLAFDRRVSVLGLGALGEACATQLAQIGFEVAGWSRSPKAIENIQCFDGDSGRHAALSRADILVLLLPKTPATENLIDADALAQMPQGAVIINPGRGPLIDDDALLAALDQGQISHATLDTFRVEPLPPAHPFWAHPKVTVTPHIASETRAKYAAKVIAENIRRGESGLPFLHLVDRARGY